MSETAVTSQESGYNFAYLDEQTKRMIRRAILKAVAVPGYQVPFASREMPLPYGWGTGGDFEFRAQLADEAKLGLKVDVVRQFQMLDEAGRLHIVGMRQHEFLVLGGRLHLLVKFAGENLSGCSPADHFPPVERPDY